MLANWMPFLELRPFARRGGDEFVAWASSPCVFTEKMHGLEVHVTKKNHSLRAKGDNQMRLGQQDSEPRYVLTRALKTPRPPQIPAIYDGLAPRFVV